MVNETKKKGPGRPPTHGGYSLIKTGKLPSGRRGIRKYLENTREGLVRDFGPTEADLSTGQIVLIDRVISKLGIVRLIEEHTRESGNIFNADGGLVGSLKESYLAFNNSVRLSLLALDKLDRQRDQETNIDDYIAETYGKGGDDD